LVERNGS